MPLSPPLTVLIILAAMVAGTVWFAPPQRDLGQATVMLPTATYQKLARWGKEQAGADGRPLSVAQTVEALASSWERDGHGQGN